jgi:hypothetical protein
LDQIKKIALSNGISCSEMIVLLLKKVMAEISNPESMGKMIKYQDRCNAPKWHVFHVKVREDTYEYWLDLRKLLKMSVSLILANAVKKYLGKPLKINRTDNYRFTNYIIAKEVMDSVIVWKFIWGIPYNLQKLTSFFHSTHY